MAKTNDDIHFICAAEELVGVEVGVEVEAGVGASLGPRHCAGELAKGVYLTGPSAVTVRKVIGETAQTT
jgi:hypothetical protein